MYRSIKKLKRTQRWAFRSAAAALGVGLLVPAVSQAGLTYDLRFSDGSSTKAIGTPGNLSLELWARVDGTNGSTADEGLQLSYLVLQSSDNSGFVGQLASGARSSIFSGSGSRNGTAADLNSDGIGDWGSNSTAASNTGYMLARSDSAVFGNIVDPNINQLDANTVEFRMATWTLQITGIVGNASAKIGVVQPTFTTGGLQPGAYAVYYQDSTDSQSSVTSSSNAGVYGDFVTITVPEPASLLGLSLGGLALLSRRRKSA